ncbi:MAG: metallophosphoesterase [Candidatus Aenigmarchaeota archaeon]|nr:metallophosphoesterase [Candidatus Aenigmarchaeota archaeon]
MKNLKILACSDIHGSQTTLDKLAAKAKEENVDFVILNGDFSPPSNENSAPPDMIGRFLRLGKKVFVLPGNHETESTIKMLEEVYGVKGLHGSYYLVNGEIGFFGCGGAELGPQPTSDAEIFERLKYAFEKVKHCRKKIMITHSHPAGSVMEKFTSFFPGSQAVRRAIDEFKPDLVVCGHVHEAAGIEEKIGNSKVVNVAKNGKVIEVE